MKKWVLPLLLLLLAAPLHADEPADLDYGDFARLPILHEGRIKPLDSVARIMLKNIYGDVSLPDEPAVKWLAGALFSPGTAARQRIFKIHSAELIRTLSLPADAERLYSFETLTGAFTAHQDTLATLIAKDRKAMNADERELAGLYTHTGDFAEIMGSFSLLAPLADIDNAARSDLGLPDNIGTNYLDLLKNQPQINAMMAETVKHKQDRISAYTPKEQRMALISYRMHRIEEAGKDNSLLRIIPPVWEGTEEWLAPWAILQKGYGSPAGTELFHLWQQLAAAYRADNALAWTQVSKELYASSAPAARSFALSLEVSYNKLDLLGKALMGYGITAGCALLYLARRRPVILSFASGAMLLSVLLHAAALCCRMCILLRPPVSTLYESMIFVGFIAACMGLWLERHRKEGEGLLIGSSIAALLLMAANLFAADGDTLEVLVAVLNTNFWLATHVVCITTGYGTSLVAGMLAHLYLFKRALRRTSADELFLLHKRMHGVALIALLFTAVGTMLGGIWADQSWGRFWGWDPKENGALWIVLWLIWLLHGRIAGQLRELAFAVCMALITIVVALAWVGVNLLSVGLHSYGFTSEAAYGLLIFCGTELLVIGLMTGSILLHKKNFFNAQ